MFSRRQLRRAGRTADGELFAEQRLWRECELGHPGKVATSQAAQGSDLLVPVWGSVGKLTQPSMKSVELANDCLRMLPRPIRANRGLFVDPLHPGTDRGIGHEKGLRSLS